MNATANTTNLTDGMRLTVEALKKNGIDTIFGVVGIPVTDLARCYTQGIGVPVDRQKAAQLYTRAAEDGDEEAMLWLGLWYREFC